MSKAEVAKVNFANFNPEEHSVYEIGGDVIPQMAEIFGHNLADEPDVDNLGELIGTVGPAKTLQDNIDKAVGRIGDSDDAVELARSWVERSGLLIPVDRSFLDPKAMPYAGSDLYIMTGGVANWIHRRADRLIEEIDSIGIQVGRVVLAAGNREMRSGERSDVMGGETEYIYMKEVVMPKLEKAGVSVDAVMGVDSGSGDDVAEQAIQQGTSSNTDIVTVVSNAGAWMQNAGQIGRAMVRHMQSSEAKSIPDRLFVISDGFPLGTGEEPTSTHQNPFSALGQIARNAQELVRWQG